MFNMGSATLKLLLIVIQQVLSDSFNILLTQDHFYFCAYMCMHTAHTNFSLRTGQCCFNLFSIIHQWSGKV